MNLDQLIENLATAIAAFPLEDELLDSLTHLWDAADQLEAAVERLQYRQSLEDPINPFHEAAAKEGRYP